MIIHNKLSLFRFFENSIVDNYIQETERLGNDILIQDTNETIEKLQALILNFIEVSRETIIPAVMPWLFDIDTLYHIFLDKISHTAVHGGNYLELLESLAHMSRMTHPMNN